MLHNVSVKEKNREQRKKWNLVGHGRVGRVAGFSMEFEFLKRPKGKKRLKREDGASHVDIFRKNILEWEQQCTKVLR